MSATKSNSISSIAPSVELLDAYPQTSPLRAVLNAQLDPPLTLDEACSGVMWFDFADGVRLGWCRARGFYRAVSCPHLWGLEDVDVRPHLKLARRRLRELRGRA